MLIILMFFSILNNIILYLATLVCDVLHRNCAKVGLYSISTIGIDKYYQIMVCRYDIFVNIRNRENNQLSATGSDLKRSVNGPGRK